MKKLIVMGMMLAGFAGFSQENVQKDGKGMEKLSTEQRDQLRLKKLTLDLSLTDSQQKEIGKILKEESVKREAAMATHKANKEKGVKPTADERFARENQILDEKIALKAKVKKILNDEQFAKWEKNADERHEKRGIRKGDRKPAGENGQK